MLTSRTIIIKLLLLSKLLKRYKRSKSKENKKSCLIIKSNQNIRGEDKGYDIIVFRSQNRIERKDTAQSAAGKAREENAAIAYLTVTKAPGKTAKDFTQRQEQKKPLCIFTHVSAYLT